MNTPALRIAGAALLVILGIWAGARVHFAHEAAQRAVDTARGTPLVRVPAGEASPPSPSDAVRAPDSPSADDELPQPKIPDRLPQFSLKDPEGRLTPISAFAGKSLIINFWATWCAPCRREIPLLERLHSEWAGRGVSVVGIAVDHRDAVLDFAKRFNIAYPLLIGDQDALDAAAALGMATPAFPFTVFTDRRGEVVALFIGELHKPQAELILAQVQSLNENQVQLAAARQAIREGLHGLQAGRPG